MNNENRMNVRYAFRGFCISLYNSVVYVVLLGGVSVCLNVAALKNHYSSSGL